MPLQIYLKIDARRALEMYNKKKEADVRAAMAEANEKIMEELRKRALEALNRRLLRSREPGRAGGRGNRGLRAALRDPDIKKAGRRGWTYGGSLGNQETFEKYDAGAYWRTIEAGGGPVGMTIPAALLTSAGFGETGGKHRTRQRAFLASPRWRTNPSSVWAAGRLAMNGRAGAARGSVFHFNGSIGGVVIRKPIEGKHYLGAARERFYEMEANGEILRIYQEAFSKSRLSLKSAATLGRLQARYTSTTRRVLQAGR